MRDQTVSVTETHFEGGSTFTQNHPKLGKVTLNTYYARDAFIRLADECGFTVDAILSVKDHDSAATDGSVDPYSHREVALLKPRQ